MNMFSIVIIIIIITLRYAGLKLITSSVKRLEKVIKFAKCDIDMKILWHRIPCGSSLIC